MPTYDEISNLPNEDQQYFHEETQRSLRRRWAKARNQTEKEIDLKKEIDDDKRRRN